MRSFALLWVCMGLALSGCTEKATAYKTAPVSGVVTVDGKPLVAARVTFLPVTEARQSQSGPEAYGETDAEGRYALKTVFGDSGGSVGPNRVMISTRKTELDPNDPDKSKQVAPERVPGKYFTDQAPLTFDVPAGGTSAANFELTTK